MYFALFFSVLWSTLWPLEHEHVQKLNFILDLLERSSFHHWQTAQNRPKSPQITPNPAKIAQNPCIKKTFRHQLFCLYTTPRRQETLWKSFRTILETFGNRKRVVILTFSVVNRRPRKHAKRAKIVCTLTCFSQFFGLPYGRCKINTF